MDFEQLVVQAGLHFANSLNPSVFPGSGDARQKATELAWLIIAMLFPRIEQVDTPRPRGSKKGVSTPAKENRLLITKPGDPDIQRLAAEIFGVGAGLELLNRYSDIMGRTLKKDRDRFDFVASLKGSFGKMKIELKGTVDEVSVNAQRKSIREKFSSILPSKYCQRIGVIVSLRTKPDSKKWDVEITDPIQEADADRDGAIRETICHYARLFDEDIGLEHAAQGLWELANQPKLIERISDLSHWLSYMPRESTVERHFNRSSLGFCLGNEQLTFWGGFWQGYAVAPPLLAVDVSKFRFAYIGLDSRVLRYLRDKDFDAFLSFKGVTGVFEFEARDEVEEIDKITKTISGVLIADSDGSIRAWLSAIPEGTLSFL